MSKDTELEKEFWEIMDYFNMCSRMELYHDNWFDTIGDNTISYIYNELKIKDSIINSYIDNGFEPQEETLKEWVTGWWSVNECIHDMFKKSNNKIKENILDIYKKSIRLHTNIYKYMNYEEFSLEMKEV
jgi:hypothetical protein